MEEIWQKRARALKPEDLDEKLPFKQHRDMPGIREQSQRGHFSQHYELLARYSKRRQDNKMKREIRLETPSSSQENTAKGKSPFEHLQECMGASGNQKIFEKRKVMLEKSRKVPIPSLNLFLVGQKKLVENQPKNEYWVSHCSNRDANELGVSGAKNKKLSSGISGFNCLNPSSNSKERSHSEEHGTLLMEFMEHGENTRKFQEKVKGISSKEAKNIKGERHQQLEEHGLSFSRVLEEKTKKGFENLVKTDQRRGRASFCERSFIFNMKLLVQLVHLLHEITEMRPDDHERILEIYNEISEVSSLIDFSSFLLFLQEDGLEANAKKLLVLEKVCCLFYVIKRKAPKQVSMLAFLVKYSLHGFRVLFHLILGKLRKLSEAGHSIGGLFEVEEWKEILNYWSGIDTLIVSSGGQSKSSSAEMASRSLELMNVSPMTLKQINNLLVPLVLSQVRPETTVYSELLNLFKDVEFLDQEALESESLSLFGLRPGSELSEKQLEDLFSWLQSCSPSEAQQRMTVLNKETLMSTITMLFHESCSPEENLTSSSPKGRTTRDTSLVSGSVQPFSRQKEETSLKMNEKHLNTTTIQGKETNESLQIKKTTKEAKPDEPVFNEIRIDLQQEEEEIVEKSQSREESKHENEEGMNDCRKKGKSFHKEHTESFQDVVIEENSFLEASPEIPEQKASTIETPNPPYLPALKPDEQDKKTLVLDLDETLIHFEEETEEEDWRIFIRPHAKEFIDGLAKYYEIVIFTAGTQDVFLL